MTFMLAGAGIALVAVVGMVRSVANDWREA